MEDVLAVGGAVAEPAEELDQLGVHAGDAQLQQRRLPFLQDLLLELGLDLLDDLLDARRVDAAVDDQPFERDPGHLAAERVEAGEDDRLGRVVDDQVDAGGHLQGADVAALAADDPPLHLVVGKHDDRDGGLGDVVGGRPLDRHADDPLRLPGGLLAGLVLDPLDDVGRLDLGLVLHDADQLVARLLGGEAGDLLETAALLLHHPVEVAFLLFEGLLAAGQGAVELVELLLPLGLLVGLLVEVVFLLGEAPLEGLQLGAPLARRRLEFAAGLEELLLGGHVGFAQTGLALPPRVFEDAVGFALRLGEDALRLPADPEPPDQEEDHAHGKCRSKNDDFGSQRCPLLSRVGGVRVETGELSIKTSPARP